MLGLAKLTGFADIAGACYNCGMTGHVQRDCPEVSSRPCFRCGESGHLARDCPDYERRADDRKCYNCGFSGHLSRDCAENNRSCYRYLRPFKILMILSQSLLMFICIR